ncbi:phosphotransferase [Sciscionella sediminilitoris]|uniref:phosphotransferase n=1 Tax=Sciscionella sediminilitoris TaxID=1445613 RepID=UPI0004DF80EC|nr:phosphotransferase [Sciscionella sp. SE31]
MIPADRVAPVLRALGIRGERITECGRGWDSRALEVDETWMVLVPREPGIARNHLKQARLLPWLAPRLPFAVPRPLLCGGLLVYRKLDGEPNTDWTGLPSALRALHGADLGHAARCCDTAPNLDSWLRYYRDRREDARRIADTLGALAGPLEEAFTAFFAGDWSSPAALVHGDLGREHVLAGNGGIRALIDFGDATIGDPVQDFIGPYLELGADRTADLIAEYGRPLPLERLAHYAWLGALEAVLYGLRTGDRHELADGLNGLAERLARL